MSDTTSDQIGRLEVLFEANTKKLEDQLKKMVKQHEDSARKVGSAWSKFTGDVELGKALDNVFSRSRFALIEEGGARLSVFGSALEDLGGYGLVAAAGVAAAVIALEQAHQAAEFADSIEKAANAAHVTTDALQEYRFALKETGGEESGADNALRAFSETLGKAKEGLGKATQAFHALGFSQDDVKGFHDTQAALDAVIERIGELKDTSQKDAIIDQLGLRDMAPLINAGVEKFRELSREAQNIGVVMDASLIERGAAANREFEALEQVISIQLKSAFVDLAPVLTGILSVLADWARTIADIADSIRDIEHKSQRGLKAKLIENSVTQAHLIQDAGIDIGLAPPPPDHKSQADEKPTDKFARQYWELDAQNKEIQARLDAMDPTPPAAHGTRDLLPKPKKAGHDDTAEREKAAEDALESATKSLASARAALAIEAQERAAFEKAAIDAELAKQQADLEAERKKVKADANLDRGQRDALLKKLNEAELADLSAAVAKKELIDRQTAEKLAQERLSLAVQDYQGQIDTLQAQADLATTSAKRRDLALRIFDLEEAVAEAKLQEVIASQESSETQKKIAQAQLQILQATLGDRRQNVVNNHLSPGQAYLKTLTDQAHDATDALQQVEVDGLKGLTDGVTDAITHVKSLGQAFHDIANQIIADLIRIAVQKYITLPLANALGLGSGGGGGNVLSSLVGGGSGGGGVLNALGHAVGFFASGTDSAPGGLSVVGEEGPELLNLPRGAQVLPNSTLKSLSRLGSTAVPSGGAVSAPYFDLRGAVVTQDLLDQMNRLNQRAIVSGIAAATPHIAAYASKKTQRDQARRARNRLV